MGEAFFMNSNLVLEHYMMVDAPSFDNESTATCEMESPGKRYWESYRASVRRYTTRVEYRCLECILEKLSEYVGILLSPLV